MNKKMIVAGVMAGVMLAGCQNLTQQLTSKIAEGVINSSTKGEVKVNMDDLQNGKITVTTKDGTINMAGNQQGGTMTMTDASGKTVMTANGNDKNYTVKDDAGKTVVQGDQNSMTMIDKNGATTTYKGEEGATRMASIPADMPSLPGATDFSFFTVNQMGSLSFSTDSKDIKGSCDQEIGLLTGAGWAEDPNGFSSESDNNIMKNYQKNGVNLTLTCATNDDFTLNIGLLETKQQPTT